MKTAAALRQLSPWSGADAARWVIVGAVGHAIAVAGWVLASREGDFYRQGPWASVGVAGFIVAAYADVTWMLRARWHLQRRRRRLFDRLLSSATAPPAPAGGSAAVAGPGLRHYHRPTCPLAAGKGWPKLVPQSATASVPCGICEP